MLVLSSTRKESRYSHISKVLGNILLAFFLAFFYLLIAFLAYITFFKPPVEPTPEEKVFFSYSFFLFLLLSILITIIVFESDLLGKIRKRAVRKTREAVIAALFPSTVIPNRVALPATLPAIFLGLCVPLFAACLRLITPLAISLLSSASLIFFLAFIVAMSRIYVNKALRRFLDLIEFMAKLKIVSGGIRLPDKYFVSEVVIEVVGVSAGRRGYSYRRALTPIRDIGLTEYIDLSKSVKAFTLVYGEYAIYVRLPAFILRDSKGSSITLAVLDPSIYQIMEAHSTVLLSDESGTASVSIRISDGYMKGRLRCIFHHKVGKVQLRIRADLPTKSRRPAHEEKFIVSIPILKTPPISMSFTQRLLPEKLTILLFFKELQPRELPDIFEWPRYTILGLSHGSYELVLEVKKGLLKKAKASAPIRIIRQQ